MYDFQIINDKILDFVNNKKFLDDVFFDKSYKLPLSDAVFCIQDMKRNFSFFQSIMFAKNDLWDDIVMLDVGSWTWILWIYGLYLWIKKVVFIENNPYSLDLSKKLINHFWYSDRSEFILWDAIDLKLKFKYDILVSETLESTLWREDFIDIINNLKKYWNDDSIIIPQKLELDIVQKDIRWNILCLDKFDYESKSWFHKQNLYLNNSINKLIFKLKLVLYNDITLKTWDCSWFINEQNYDFKNKKHRLFELIL
jgi:hypothetical protein